MVHPTDHPTDQATDQHIVTANRAVALAPASRAAVERGTDSTTNAPPPSATSSGSGTFVTRAPRATT